MQYRTYFATALLIFLAGCKAFEDADLTERKTFVHFYSSSVNYVASVAEIDADGGYILSGDVNFDNGRTDALIIKTDERGHKLWEKVIPKSVIKAIKPTSTGYILAGDSIQLNSTSVSGDLNELENTYARVLIVDAQGNTMQQHLSTASIQKSADGEIITLTVDFHADALTLDQNGNILVLGSFRIPGEKEAAFVSAFNPSDISDSLWLRSYRSLDHDLYNAHALHLNSTSNLVWASSTQAQLQNVTREYLSVSYVTPNSTFRNNSIYGESDERNHSVKDIQKSSVGFGAIGTYSETSGLNGNIYFVRIDGNLNVIPGSAKYIDGEELMLNNNIFDFDSRTTSNSFDEGLAIAATSDGYVLGCAITSTPSVGNGGKDILLVKLDPVGNLLWKKLLGGTGDETIVSIRETADGGLLLFGTNTINGLSSLMLIKTDGQGEITD